MFIALIVAAVSAFFIGFKYGYDFGVEHTEQRWSDAVARKDDYDHYMEWREHGGPSKGFK